MKLLNILLFYSMVLISISILASPQSQSPVMFQVKTSDGQTIYQGIPSQNATAPIIAVASVNIPTDITHFTFNIHFAQNNYSFYCPRNTSKLTVLLEAKAYVLPTNNCVLAYVEGADNCNVAEICD